MTATGGVTCVASLDGHKDVVWSVAWSPPGDLLASCSSDRTIRIWAHERDGRWLCVAVLDSAHRRTVRSVAWSPDATMLASGGFDGLVCIWQRDTDEDATEYRCVATLEGHDNEVKSVAWCATSDSPLLATCSRDKSVWIWELVDDGDFECVSVLQGHTQDVKLVKWAPAQTMLVSASYDDTLRVWAEDEDDWFCVSVLKGHTSTVWSCDFIDRRGERMASCSDDRTVIIWHNPAYADLPSEAQWTQVQVIAGCHDRPIMSLSWRPGSSAFATSGADDKICFYAGGDAGDDDDKDDAGRYRVRGCIEHAHEGEINVVCWSPAGDMLASAGDDHTVRLWAASPIDT